MIYLDHNATTPVDPAVAEKMAWVLREHFGNPSSLYPIGRRVKELMNEARERVAGSLGVDRGEIYFTGSGTESDNFAIFGTFEASPGRDEFVTSAIEHPAVIEAAKALEARGVKVTYLPVDAYGTVDLDHLRSALTPKTALVSIMHANNEIGTIQPIAGHRPDRPRARRRRPHRRRPDLRQDRRRRPEARRRLPDRFGPQDLRPQGDRRPLHPPGDDDLSLPARRSPGAGSPGRDREHGRHRRVRRGRPRPRGEGPQGARPGRTSGRDAQEGRRGRDPRREIQRSPGRPGQGHAQFRLPRARGRGHPPGPGDQGDLRLDGLGLQRGVGGGLARPPGHRPAARDRPLVDPHVPRPVQHRGGHRRRPSGTAGDRQEAPVHHGLPPGRLSRGASGAALADLPKEALPDRPEIGLRGLAPQIGIRPLERFDARPGEQEFEVGVDALRQRDTVGEILGRGHDSAAAVR